MSDFDEFSNRLTLKLVYYGPALSGKTTNLISLHDMIRPHLRGEMMSMETRGDRTLFFDLLPLGFTAPSGLLIKFKLYTVPGQVQHDSTRKAVLSRADGVVFVADSQRSQGINNGEAFENLAANAARVGLDFEKLPLVVQFNKRDLPSILEKEEILERWGEATWPLFFSTALTGEQVVETLAALLQQVYHAVDQSHALASGHGLDQEQFIAGILGEAHDNFSGEAI